MREREEEREGERESKRGRKRVREGERERKRGRDMGTEIKGRRKTENGSMERYCKTPENAKHQRSHIHVLILTAHTKK